MSECDIDSFLEKAEKSPEPMFLSSNGPILDNKAFKWPLFLGKLWVISCSASARCGSCTAEVEFEFTTWAWVQATAEMAFCGGLVVRSPGSIKALNQSTHNSLGHCRNVHLAVAGHCRKFILQWPATAEWTFRQWPRELWVDWFNALTEPGDRTTRPLPNAISVVAWTQAQMVNSNSTSRVKETQPGWASAKLCCISIKQYSQIACSNS